MNGVFVCYDHDDRYYEFPLMVKVNDILESPPKEKDGHILIKSSSLIEKERNNDFPDIVMNRTLFVEDGSDYAKNIPLLRVESSFNETPIFLYCYYIYYGFIEDETGKQNVICIPFSTECEADFAEGIGEITENAMNAFRSWDQYYIDSQDLEQ